MQVSWQSVQEQESFEPGGGAQHGYVLGSKANVEVAWSTSLKTEFHMLVEVYSTVAT